MEDDDNGELDERNTYNARTSKFLATTWRKFPEPEREPISLLAIANTLLIFNLVITPPDDLYWFGERLHLIYTVIRALKRYSGKESVKVSDGKLIFRKNPMVHDQRGTEF
jgi:hypothetical protein